MRWWRALMWWRPPCLLRTVVISLKDDPGVGLHGVLWRTRGPWLVLRQPSTLSADGQKTAIAGAEALVHRSNVAFLVVES
jgi:hypothetical protein